MVLPIRKLLNIKMKKRAVLQLTYKASLTRKQIQKIANAKSKALKDAGLNGKVQITLYYPDLGWRTADWTDTGKETELFNFDNYEGDFEEPERFTQFRMYVINDGESAGGCDGSYNDCLHNCLFQVIPVLPWKYADKLKEMLKIGRKDKIDISRMEEIEKMLPEKYKINVKGDALYTSIRKCKSPHILNINLIDGHYTLENKEQKKLNFCKGIAEDEKEILIYKKKGFDIEVINDEYDIYEITKEEFQEIRSKPKTSEYMLVRYDETKKNTMEEQIKNFIHIADVLKNKSNGRINLYKTGSLAKTALNLFCQMNRLIYADAIEQNEAEFLMNGTLGGLIYGECYEGKTYKYDYNSFYNSIMKNCHSLYPVKAGEYKYFSQKEFEELKIFPFGIYKCVIEKREGMKLFRYSKKNTYTHYDLGIAQREGLKITMVDVKPNMIYYKRADLIEGNLLFGDFVDYLEKLRNDIDDEECKKALKIMRSSLYGIFMKKNILNCKMKENEEFTVGNEKEIESIIPLKEDGDDLQINLIKKYEIYDNNFARVGIFLLSKARNEIYKKLKEHEEKLVRAHTDGFLLTEDCFEKNVDKSIGLLKYEGCCKNTIIKNAMKVIGNWKV